MSTGKMKEISKQDLKRIIGEIAFWVYECHDSEGVRDMCNAAQLTEDEIKELELEDLLKDDERDEEGWDEGDEDDD